MEHTCEVCGKESKQRCSRCKASFYCGEECFRSAWKSGHRQVCGKQVVSTASVKKETNPSKNVALPLQRVAPSASDDDFVLRQVVHSLGMIHEQGWCIFELPDDVHQLYQDFLTDWRKFFAQPQKPKDVFRTKSLVGGYMTPYPGLHEVFEHKEVHRDPNFQCPPQCVETTRAVFQWCERISLLCWKVMQQYAAQYTSQQKTLLANKDSDAQHSESEIISSSFSSGVWCPRVDSTLRILHYDGATPHNAAQHDLHAVFPDHTDSSLVTLAPRSSWPALEMRSFASRQWSCVEQQMSPHQAVLFVGDTGAYHTSNVFPAPLHRPSPTRMTQSVAADEPARIASPFFLRAHATEVLRPESLRPGCGLPALTVHEMDNNIGGCRDRTPWKLGHPYYDDMKYST